MEGPWLQLVAAFEGFLRVRARDSAGADNISVVQFANTARLTCEFRTIGTMLDSFELKCGGGGTSFVPALDSAQALLERHPAAAKVLVFMSDGENGDKKDAAERLSDLCKQVPDVVCHMIFFGDGSGQEMLRRMANAAPGGRGQFHLSVGGIELATTFQDIASFITKL